MNRNQRIWIVIGIILAIGLLVTSMTASFVKNQETLPESRQESSIVNPELLDSPKSPVEVQKVQGEPLPDEELKHESYSKIASKKVQESLPDETFKSELEAASDTAGAPDFEPESEQAPEEETDTQPVSPAAEPVITPVSPDSRGRSAGDISTAGAAYYQKHLAELDARIQKMRENSGDSNTYSMKGLADKELKLWNQEMNAIYTAVSDGLDDEARQALEEAQRTWIKDRDAKAEETAKKYSGGSLEGLEYTASLAESTRGRAYDLVDEYMEALSDTEGQ